MLSFTPLGISSVLTINDDCSDKTCLRASCLDDRSTLVVSVSSIQELVSTSHSILSSFFACPVSISCCGAATLPTLVISTVLSVFVILAAGKSLDCAVTEGLCSSGTCSFGGMAGTEEESRVLSSVGTCIVTGDALPLAIGVAASLSPSRGLLLVLPSTDSSRLTPPPGLKFSSSCRRATNSSRELK